MGIAEKYSKLHEECKKHNEIQLTTNGLPYSVNAKKKAKYIAENFAKDGLVEKFCTTEKTQKFLDEIRAKRKYLGIIKCLSHSMSGINLKIITKSSEDKSLIEDWMKSYPKEEQILIECDEKTADFFNDFEDISLNAMTEDERKSAYELYKKCMNEE